MANDLSVAILAGGLGTRLRSVVADRPKVLAPVQGRPYLRFLLDQVARTCVREVVLLAGHGVDQLHATMGESHQSLRLVYSVEQAPLGTAGAVRHALQHFRSRSVLLLNGDSYCAVDLARFQYWHQWQREPIGLVLTRVPDTGRYGRVRLNKDGKVRSFEEKGATAGPGWINAGVYLLDRELIAALPPGRALSLECQVLPGWVDRGLVHGYRSRGQFLDIGTPESYAAADSFFARRSRRREVRQST